MNARLIFQSLLVGLVVLLLAAGCRGETPPETPVSQFDEGIIFFSELTSIEAGECTFLHWEIPEGIRAALDGEEVPLSGDREVCLTEPRAYELDVDLGTRIETRRIEIAVKGELAEQPTAESEQEPAKITPGEPAYLAKTWVRLGGPPGGLGYDIRMRPDNPDEMYVTDAHAGIFKSDDGGQTWYDTNNNLYVISDAGTPVFCATIDPHDYNAVWIGTQITGHIYRTADGGQSWDARDSGIVHDGRSVRGITVDPNQASVVYAGLEVEAGMWQREHPEASPQAVGGEVYKSSDSGQTWTRIWQGPNIARYIWVDPRNSKRLFVSTGIFDRMAANANPADDDLGGVGVLRSDDGGQTWVVLDERSGLGGRIIPSLFMHPTNPDVLIAAVYDGRDRGGVYETEDGGDSWKQILKYNAGMHNVEIATSDTDIWYAATENVAFRSDDAGQTWHEYPLALPDRLAGMPIDLQVDPRDPYRIFVNNYGGSNFLSSDGGVTWTDASKGYTGAFAYVSIMPDGSVLAKANTGIFHSTDAGQSWVGLTRNEESGLSGDRDRQTITSDGGFVMHSSDNGTTWSPLQVVDLFAEAQAGRINNDALASRLAAAPSEPNTVYLAFVDNSCQLSIVACIAPMPGFFRSHDNGFTWETLSGGPFEDVSVLRIVVGFQDSQMVFAATGGGLYQSGDGGRSWQLNSGLNEAVAQVEIWDPESALTLSGAMVITDFALDPFDSKVMYASAFQRGVFKSEDGGITWRSASFGMDPNEPVLVITPDPVHPDLIYAGSNWSGVYVSTDRAKTWQHISEGLISTPIISLALSLDGSTLYAGTSWAGVWRLGEP
jgi:photosystem II stability/assembly factor-like uncharacterized protein